MTCRSLKYSLVLISAALILVVCLIVFKDRTESDEKTFMSESHTFPGMELIPETSAAFTEPASGPIAITESPQAASEENVSAEETALTPEATLPETTAVPETTVPETAPPPWHMQDGSHKTMVRIALSYASWCFGYSLSDRTGQEGHFDCSGFLAVLLRDALGEHSVGWFSSGPWDTAYWRNYASRFNIGDVVTFGSAKYTVTMKESYDFANAWAIPGSIVVQYPPENDPSTKMGHISVALGRIPYQTTDDVVAALEKEYGVSLSGLAGGPNGIPKVYDPYGAGAGHDTWRISANGIAGCVCVDNHYASRPEWIERIAIVFTPVM